MSPQTPGSERATPGNQRSPGFGRTVTWVSRAVAVLGLFAIAASFPLGVSAAVLPGFAAAWLFCAGLAAGAVALSAATRVAQGRFLEPVLPLLESAGAFLPLAAVLLVALLASSWAWLPEHAQEGLFALAVRDLLAFGLLALAGRRVLRRSGPARWTPAALRDSVVYLLVFVATVSLWTVDLVMKLYEGEPSGIVPAQAFMAAFLAAIAWTALLTAWKSHSIPARQDLGRLLFGFCAFWAYLVWCSFLPVWYANLPGETAEIVLRTEGSWRFFSYAVVLSSFLVPFLLLFSESAKRQRLPVTLAAGFVLGGLFAERALLVLRPLEQVEIGLPMLGGALAALGVLGLFVLNAGARLERPAPVEVEPAAA